MEWVKLFRSKLSRIELSWAKCSRTFTQSRIVEGLLHTENILVGKQLGVTVAYVRWSIDYEKHTQKATNTSVMIKHIDLSLAKTY